MGESMPPPPPPSPKTPIAEERQAEKQETTPSELPNIPRPVFEELCVGQSHFQNLKRKNDEDQNNQPETKKPRMENRLLKGFYVKSIAVSTFFIAAI